MKKKFIKIANTMLLVASIVLINSCDEDNNPIGPINYPDKAILNKRIVMSTVGEVNVYNGGYGSAAASTGDGYFYAMTDRGPNIDGSGKDEKVFSNPEFTPQIGKFKLEGDSLVLVSTIEIKNPAGQKITGLPNPIGAGGTGETPKDINGNTLNTDIYGLDPEGLVAMKDGSFWISDEYGPHIVHLNSNGQEIERFNPYNTAKKLPPVFAKRRANRGMEGLTITPDGKYLVGIMQSPLYNPDKSVKKNATICRILFFELATGKSKEYLYALDNTNMANSEITAISNTTFLVLERDGNMPGKDTSCSKKIYKIDISKATDITTDLATGKMIGDKTIEQCTAEELLAAGIVTVTKELAFDIMSIPNYPHDKPEGVIIINDNLIAIVNDDDFGIGGEGTYEAKISPLLNNEVDRNIMYFVKPLKALK
ncbi:MAG: esterase-like activity of phytase family protein [Candidatus Kapaibacterium sp.]|jgi:hypothetical protein